MKKIFLCAATVIMMVACVNKRQADIYVFNPLEFERADETVEIPWDSLTARIAGLVPDSVAVFDPDGVEIPSQVIFFGTDKPQSLVFQATVKAAGRTKYTIREAPRGEYKHMAFGRYVPERKDDYAWENNKIALRIYGPSLEQELVTPGIDAWSKSTQELIVDKWYKSGDYHHDHGEGLDAYKVGTTLGAGGSAPVGEEKLWLSRNYIDFETLDNGPLRTTVRLNYAPFDFNGTQVSLIKVISLDANTHFNKVVNYYKGDFESIPVAAGMPMHEGAMTSEALNCIMLTEPASDLQDPEAYGDISIGVVMPGVSVTMELDGHWLIVGNAENNRPFVYWTGTGWSRGGIADSQMWNAIVEQQALKVATPLQVSYKK